MKDQNVENVINKYKSRASKGYEKYGITTEREDIDLSGWITHLQEELMDAVLYCQAANNLIKTLESKHGIKMRYEEGI